MLTPVLPDMPYKLWSQMTKPCTDSLCGGLFTQNARKHWNQTDGACQWCGQEDSLQHRYYECAATRELRQTHAPQILQHKLALPDVLTLRGWAIRPPTYMPWMRQFTQMPEQVPPMHAALALGQWNYVFTDGSCYAQHLPAQRFAAWSAVLAKPCATAWDPEVHGIMGAATLVGLVQTAYRAELYAVGYVLHHAALIGAHVVIFCDCLGVVNKTILLLTGHVRIHLNKHNSDLWLWIQHSL